MERREIPRCEKRRPAVTREELLTRISIDPKVCSGKPVIRNTRIAVEFVIDLLGRGWTPEQVLKEYEHLRAEDIQACLVYASEMLKSE